MNDKQATEMLYQALEPEMGGRRVYQAAAEGGGGAAQLFAAESAVARAEQSRESLL